ncbi:hypothetical protein G7Y89_g2198 [Cudoniella acicularis]|uniref:Uncharacterized protein n=1 Tax=Cudoniella acicularis TaxID=354080 RepID=A0A8H4W6A5_9HELO|nr:hypothetical protein G7Y89_g2198 [Cudoniella acicularis]
MPSNKDRLYVVLYARGGLAKMPGKEDTYHWALIVGPKDEEEGGHGMRYHAKERMIAAGQSEWFFDERETTLEATSMLLVRITVAKVKKMDQLVNTLRSVPIKQGEPGWNCVIWVKEALQALQTDGKALGTSDIEWQKVRDAAMRYVQEKKDEHRFDGKGDFNMKWAATYSLLEGKETTP